MLLGKVAAGCIAGRRNRPDMLAGGRRRNKMSRALSVGLTLVLFVAPYGSGMGSRHIVTPSQPFPLSYFGMHIQHTVISVEAAPPTLWPSVTVPEWRLWDARLAWPDIEPQKGEWRFGTLDNSAWRDLVQN
jgi:hypothetical protein